ncbi:MAG: hypothetical protein H6561_13525 [Lewinellaceae bacterium]|nr:hypothetical protein [Lewinellaceae bacterium]
MFKSFTAILILGGVLGMACPAFGQTGDPCKDGIQTSALQTTNIGYNKAELVCNVTADIIISASGNPERQPGRNMLPWMEVRARPSI